MDGAELTEGDYELGCIVTFERLECRTDGTTRFLSDLGTGGIGQEFFARVDPESIREYCNRSPEEVQANEDFAHFTLSMCLVGATPAEAIEMAEDEGFTESQLAILPALVESCPD